MIRNLENLEDSSSTHPFQKILETLKPGMTTPEIAHCPDNHF